ncbi:MAG: hypothetical protein IIB00_07525 [candidate division Zixibacteria bacterium]|nr:hypothetical protein [candidate division Zixibacteria bacterium]
MIERRFNKNVASTQPLQNVEETNPTLDYIDISAHCQQSFWPNIWGGSKPLSPNSALTRCPRTGIGENGLCRAWLLSVAIGRIRFETSLKLLPTTSLSDIASMGIIFEPPWNYLFSGLLTSISLPLFRKSFLALKDSISNPGRQDQSIRTVRGFRAGIIGIAFLFAAGGVYTDTSWPLWFAAAFIAEELLETGFMIFVLKKHRSKTRKPTHNLWKGRTL